ncbi:MAG: hydroxyisourate hydrolase [Nocardioides sp.]
MTTCSTHVLDAALGTPASGLSLALSDVAGATVATAMTDGDGRVSFEADLPGGVYAITFSTGPWFASAGRSTLFPAVEVVFEVDPAERHYHVALLLSPYSYTTYRGS